MDTTWWSVSFIPDSEMIVLTLGEGNTRYRIVLTPEESEEVVSALQGAIQRINLNILKKV